MTLIDLPASPPGVPLAASWDGTIFSLLDQRRLPHEVVHEVQDSGESVFAAIREMRVRGAPAIGIAAAFGLALAMKDDDGSIFFNRQANCDIGYQIAIKICGCYTDNFTIWKRISCTPAQASIWMAS